MNSPVKHCPCNPAMPYSHCCEPYHLGLQSPATPELLMRSRYSAFVLENYEYLIHSHDTDFSADLTEENLKPTTDLIWLGLEVIETDHNKKTGQVTFKAWYHLNGKIDAIYEISNFINKNNRWYYTDGEQKHTQLPKRNDACICHSGRKFKHCCMKKITA